MPTGYSPDDVVVDVFAEASTYPVSIKDASLLEALEFLGGPGTDGGARILLKQAVAALLNSAHPDLSYPLTEAQVIDQVNGALDSQDRTLMITLAEQLDGFNNSGCQLNAKGTPGPTETPTATAPP